jgi:hypothetical protein
MDKVALVTIPDSYNRSEFYRLLNKVETSINQAAQGRLFPVRRITSSTTLSVDDATVLVDASGGAVTVTLRPARECEQKRVTIKKVDSSANAVTIDADGSETIDGATAKSLASQYNYIELVAEGGAWWIVSN